jgi:hypothetical protein
MEKLKRKGEKKGEDYLLCIVSIVWNFSISITPQRKMETIRNISLSIPDIYSALSKKELIWILQEKCHLGIVSQVEMIENLILNLESPTETNHAAFVYFQYWYPTLGNVIIQDKLELGESIAIPLNSNTPELFAHAYKNNFSLPVSDFEELEESKNVEEQSQLYENKIVKELEERLEEELEEQDNLKSMEEELSNIIGEESFDLVDADYAACLERQLSSILYSTAPITLQ